MNFAGPLDAAPILPGTAVAVITQIALYPVKSMRGVAVAEASLGFNGLYGDRRYAFVRKGLAASDGFPWMTGRQNPQMLLYAPCFARLPTKDDAEPPIRVRAPSGAEFDLTDAQLCAQLERESGLELFLLKSKRGNFDSQHVSIFSLATHRYLSVESNCEIDPRQFRANLYIEPADGAAFGEEAWVGRVLQVGGAARVAVTQKDARCMMINLDPETATQRPQVLRTVARNHDEQAGVYANVIAAGLVRVGDPITIC